LIEVCNTRPVKHPYPKNYDPNTKCDYHGGALGHSTKACVAFKKKVQLLIDSGLLSFEEGQPTPIQNMYIRSVLEHMLDRFYNRSNIHRCTMSETY